MPFLLLLLLPLPLQRERGPSPPTPERKVPQEIPPGVLEQDRKVPQLIPRGAQEMVSDDSTDEIARFSRLHGMDPLLIRAVVEVESAHDPLARSPRGAMGLMQLTPVTIREMNVRDPWDRAENLEAGIRYLRRLLDRFDENLVLALAAYNAGPSRVRQYRGVPPFPETRTYVRQVLARYRRFQREAGEASAASTGEEGG